MSLQQMFIGFSETMDGLDRSTVEEILHGNIGENIKRKVIAYLLEAFETQIVDNLHETINKFRLSRKSIITKFREITNDSFLNEMESYLGLTLMSNYTFAMKVMIEIFNMIFTALENIPSDLNIPNNLGMKLKLLVEKFVNDMLKPSDLPDSLEAPLDNTINPVQVSLTMGFNHSVLMVLVFVVAHIVKFRISLSNEQIEELEELLRDWTQEILTQTELLQRRQKKSLIKVTPRTEFSMENDEHT